MKLDKSKIEVQNGSIVIISDTLCKHCNSKAYPICKKGIDLRTKTDYKSCLLFNKE